MTNSTTRELPPSGSLTADSLRALPEGALVVTYGAGWAKIGPDLWKCPYKLHVPDDSISDRWRGRYLWADERDSEWMAEVVTMVAFNPAEWGL